MINSASWPWIGERWERNRVQDARLGIYGLLTLVAAMISVLWFSTSPLPNEERGYLVYGMAALLVIAFGSATVLQARGATGPAAVTVATVLLVVSPILSLSGGTDATMLLFPLVAVIVALPHSRGVRGVAIGIMAVVVGMVDRIVSSGAAGSGAADPDLAMSAITAGAAVGTIVIALWRQRREIELSAEELEAAARSRTAVQLALRDLRAGDRPETTAGAIVRELADTGAFSDVALVAQDPDGTLRRLASWAAGTDPGPETWGPNAATDRIRQRVAGGAWVEAATPTDPLPWLVSANGVEHACVPLVAGGDTVGLLLAGSLDHGPHATTRLGDLTEVAAIASALLGPAILERVEERRLHAEVSRVIADRCFRPIFQPIVDLTTGDVIGYEALTRFADDRRPDRVFADAHRVGLGVELEAATFEGAVQAARALPGNQTLHLNVSPDFVLSGPRFRELVSSAGRVVLEITEHTEVQDYETLRAAIAELGDCVRLAVDDAGAGYASLRHILELRPSVVKVDRGIVAGVDRDPARQAVLAGIVHFARQAKCSLVAEGVETEAERDALLGVGISRGQGWLFGGVVQADNPTGPAGP